jgi:ATP-dependent RNA helicase DDX24/MAK5
MIKNGHFRELQSIIDMFPEAGDSIGGQSKSLENCETLSTCKERKDRLLFFLQL